MNHLRACVGLLVVVGHGDRVELADRIVAHQHAAWVFPRDGRTRLDLRPRDFGALAATKASLRDEVIHAAFAVLIARIPVLHGAVFHLCVCFGNNLHDGRMKLVFIALRCRATFHITHIRAFVGHDEGALKLTRVGCVDAEIRREFQRTTHAFWDIAERAVAEHRRVQSGKEIIGVRHDRPEVLFHQVGVLLDRLAERHEDDAVFRERVLEGRLHRSRVHHRIDGHAREFLLLVQRDAEFVESVQQFGINLVEALYLLAFARRGVIDNVLIVNFGKVEVRPVGLFQRLPMAEGLQTELQQPFRFLFLLGNQANNVLIQTFRRKIGFNVGHEAVFILFACNFADNIVFRMLVHFLLRMISN